MGLPPNDLRNRPFLITLVTLESIYASPEPRIPPVIKVHDFTSLSDHAPLSAQLRTRCTDNDQRVPMDLLHNDVISQKVVSIYNQNLPPFLAHMKTARSRGQADRICRSLVYTIVDP